MRKKEDAEMPRGRDAENETRLKTSSANPRVSASPRPRVSHSPFLLELTVFTCGALVMIYEITGSRLLAPYIGASVYVWTSLIGVILAALSLGYWLGGKLADRKPDIKILAFVIFLAGGAVAVTILFKDLILSFIAQIPVFLEIKSVLAAILLFAPASVLLGFVTPYAVKLKMSSLEDAGKTVGRLYALSTVGSILGTFLAGFFLIPFIGSTRTLYFIAAILFVISILLAPFALTRLNLTLIIVFIFGIGANELKSYFLASAYDYHEIDTPYSNVRIFTAEEPETERKIRYLAIDPYYIQSSMYLDTGESSVKYIKFYHLLRHFKPDFEKSLLIGGAGYSFPRDYLQEYPQAEIDVVEIDPQMTEIAKRFFRLEENPRLRVFHQDGRIFLNQAESNQYDTVFMDAFGSLFSVPFQLTTLEAVREIHRVLK
ncbi:MAG TPA: fused MFS/spermidine synthase, partial [Pyrinomonadaceae bacterium]|nr:fused MFS/spermidine synthase [Pyrinomonadaceae bacterium]